MCLVSNDNTRRKRGRTRVSKRRRVIGRRFRCYVMAKYSEKCKKSFFIIMIEGLEKIYSEKYSGKISLNHTQQEGKEC